MSEPSTGKWVAQWPTLPVEAGICPGCQHDKFLLQDSSLGRVCRGCATAMLMSDWTVVPVLDTTVVPASDHPPDDALLASAFRKVLGDEQFYVCAMRQEWLDEERQEQLKVVFTLCLDGTIADLTEAELAAIQRIRP